MHNVIIGIVLLLLGVWGIVSNWYQFWDLIWVIVPMLLLVGGITYIMAGINGTRRKA